MAPRDREQEPTVMSDGSSPPASDHRGRPPHKHLQAGLASAHRIGAHAPASTGAGNPPSTFHLDRLLALAQRSPLVAGLREKVPVDVLVACCATLERLVDTHRIGAPPGFEKILLQASLEDFERYVRICNPVISDVGPADIAAYLKYAEEVVLTSS